MKMPAVMPIRASPTVIGKMRTPERVGEVSFTDWKNRGI